MSKYDPLRSALERERASSVPMSFRDIEEILGFPLPRSARQYQPWWANTGGSHVHAQSWLKAGWRATGVDLGRERLTFVRDYRQPAAPSAARRTPAPKPSLPAAISLRTSELSPLARDFLSRRMSELNSDAAAAVEAVLAQSAIQHRKNFLSRFAGKAGKVPGDSTELIREDRDAR